MKHILRHYGFYAKKIPVQSYDAKKKVDIRLCINTSWNRLITMKRYAILNEIFHRAGTDRFITLYELETETGLSGSKLRPLLEDLKEECLIVEHPEGFQISGSGMHFCKRRWA